MKTKSKKDQPILEDKDLPTVHLVTREDVSNFKEMRAPKATDVDWFQTIKRQDDGNYLVTGSARELKEGQVLVTSFNFNFSGVKKDTSGIDDKLIEVRLETNLATLVSVQERADHKGRFTPHETGKNLYFKALIKPFYAKYDSSSQSDSN